MSFPRVHRLWLSVILSGLALMLIAGCAQSSNDSTSRPDPKLGVEQPADAGSQSDSDADAGGAGDADPEGAGDADVEGAKAADEDDGSGSGKDVAIVGFAFQPATLTIKAGTAVIWTNEDAANHQVHADDNAFKSDIFGKDGQTEVTYSAPGTFTYHCHVHPNMQGTIVVE